MTETPLAFSSLPSEISVSITDATTNQCTQSCIPLIVDEDGLPYIILKGLPEELQLIYEPIWPKDNTGYVGFLMESSYSTMAIPCVWNKPPVELHFLLRKVENKTFLLGLASCTPSEGFDIKAYLHKISAAATRSPRTVLHTLMYDNYSVLLMDFPLSDTAATGLPFATIVSYYLSPLLRS